MRMCFSVYYVANAKQGVVSLNKRQLTKCRDCKHYDTTPFPLHEGKLALCRNEKSWLFKVGFKTVANKDCFERLEV